MDNRTGFRRRGPAFLAEQARQALGVSGDIRSLAEIPLPLVHTAFGAAVCAVAVLLRPQEIGLQASAIAAGVLAVITVMVLTGYDMLVYPPEQRPGLEGSALPLGAVVAFAAVLAGVTPLSVRAAAGVVAALVIGGVPQLVGRRVLGREGWLVRLLRDIAGVLVLAPVLLAGASPVLATTWRLALVGSVTALVSFDGLRTERLPRARAAPAALAIGAVIGGVAALVGPSTGNAGARAAILLVLWYGLRGMGGVLAIDARRAATLLEYGAFVMLAAGALRWITLQG